MVYNSRNLSVLAYANGFTLWHYVTTDSIWNVEHAGYFAGAEDLLRAGDMILVSATDMIGAPLVGAILFVFANADGTVAVKNLARR